MKMDIQGRAALLRGLDFWRRGSAALPIVVIFLAAIGAMAQTTNTLSDGEIQGHKLAQKLLDQRPTENFTNTGTLRITGGSGRHTTISVTFKTIVHSDSWQTVCNAKGLTAELSINHKDNQPNVYFNYAESDLILKPLSNSGINSPFANSDFWLGDLGLEFLHWPGQKILHGDTARGRLCKVLESTNPNPSTNGYSRVLCWIDNETLGIVEAEAYDAKNKKLKEFYPKDFKKVDGQWQVGSMEIDNVQTGSRTKLDFDLKAK